MRRSLMVAAVSAVAVLLAGCSGRVAKDADAAATPVPSASAGSSSRSDGQMSVGDARRLFTAEAMTTVAQLFAANPELRDPDEQDLGPIVSTIIHKPGVDTELRDLAQYPFIRVYVTCDGVRSFDVALYDSDTGDRLSGFGGNSCGGPRWVSAAFPHQSARRATLKVTIKPFGQYSLSVMAPPPSAA